MNSSRILTGLFLLMLVFPVAIAYRERGIAERMLYWSAYICEEQTKAIDPKYEYTVAPGCGVSRGSRLSGKERRCTLDEFLIHIWAEKKDSLIPDIVKPDGMEKSTGIHGYPKISFNQFFGALTNSKFDTGVLPDGNVDSKKLYPGASDYYDALSKMGRPIEALSQAYENRRSTDPKYKLTNKIKNPWMLGKNCAYYVFALRYKDMDSHRANYLREHLNAPKGAFGGFHPEWRNLDTAKMADGGQRHESIPAIDFDATIDVYKSSVPNIEDLLKKHTKGFMNVQKPPGHYINEEHFKAIEAARSAMTGCKCEGRIPVNLKKKRWLTNLTAHTEELWKEDPVAVHWGGQKAAKSRMKRAERLASIGVEIKAF